MQWTVACKLHCIVSSHHVFGTCISLNWTLIVDILCWVADRMGPTGGLCQAQLSCSISQSIPAHAIWCRPTDAGQLMLSSDGDALSTDTFPFWGSNTTDKPKTSIDLLYYSQVDMLVYVSVDIMLKMPKMYWELHLSLIYQTDTFHIWQKNCIS